nr:hypothetical protein [Desulfobacterales bacterium]
MTSASIPATALKQEKRIRHERTSNRTGRVYQIICFDCKDTDGDGYVNVWQTYRNDKRLERRIDDDGDGRLKRIIFYNVNGLPKESLHGQDVDGRM